MNKKIAIKTKFHLKEEGGYKIMKIEASELQKIADQSDCDNEQCRAIMLLARSVGAPVTLEEEELIIDESIELGEENGDYLLRWKL